MDTLKTGCRAYFDSFSGLIPAKVLSVVANKTEFDLRFGEAKASTRVTLEITKDFGCYKLGEIVETNAIHAIPVKAVKQALYSSHVVPYRVEHDAN